MSGTRVVWLGYDAAARRLEAGLRDGSVRDYLGVPSSVHAGLLAAADFDRYFEAHVEKAGYQSRRFD